MSSTYFTICGFFCALLILILFFSKERIKSEETKLYSFMIISSFVDVLLVLTALFIGIYKIDSSTIPLIIFINKIDMIHYILWPTLMFLYIFYITYHELNKYKKILKVVTIIDIIAIFVSLFLPLDIINNSKGMGIGGIGTNYIYSIAVLYFLAIVLILLLNYKKIFNKKYLPIFSLLVLMAIAVIVRYINQTLIVIPSIIVYTNMIMYFTIENPDIKLLNEVEAARDKAEKANAAKTDFLSSMSHEIRTPLNAIVGFSEAIQDEEDLASAKQDAKDIILASQNLLEIVNGILDISKIEANKMEITNCDYSIIEECQTIYKLIKPRIGEKPIEFIMNVAPDIPNTLYGDKGKIKEIITNLLTNAVKYTEKGTITFDISCINKNNNSTIIISVEDTGRGIKPEKIDKLFTKFERLDEDRNTTLEGTGLGLAITKRLVEMLNGKIIVQSVFGSGSKFTVYLPQIISANQKIETIKKENNLDLSTKKVLVVDDNDLNLKIAERLLKKYNLQIETCKSGYECLDKINNNQKYDLIFMDDMMPKMSGAETLHILKDNPDFKTKVIVLTANAIEGMKEKYIEDGFNDYLAKPIEKEELERILRHYLNSEIESANFAPLPKELYQIDDNVIKKLNSKEFIENKKV